MQLILSVFVFCAVTCFSAGNCDGSDKIQAQQIRWQFVPSLKEKRALQLETTLSWVDLHLENKDYYASYPFSVYKGLRGNFGALAQYGTRKGKVLFSIENEHMGKRRRAIPIHKNCQFTELKHSSVDITGSGVQCSYGLYNAIGSADYKFKITQVETGHKIDENDFCGIGRDGEELLCGEAYAGAVGDIWEVSIELQYTDPLRHNTFVVGKILLEGHNGEGIDKISALGEFVGCDDCQSGGVMVERRIAPKIMKPSGIFAMKATAKLNCDKCQCEAFDIVSPTPMYSDLIFGIEVEPTVDYHNHRPKVLWDCHTLEECGHEADPNAEVSHSLSHTRKKITQKLYDMAPIGEFKCKEGFEPIHTMTECKEAVKTLQIQGFSLPHSEIETTMDKNQLVCNWCGDCSPIVSRLSNNHRKQDRYICKKETTETQLGSLALTLEALRIDVMNSYSTRILLFIWGIMAYLAIQTFMDSTDIHQSY